MIDKWNYFEPREILPSLPDIHAIACKINLDKTLSYWVLDDNEGFKKITFTCEELPDDEYEEKYA